MVRTHPVSSPYRILRTNAGLGPIYQIRIFSTPLLVLNTAEAARETLDAKSALYANRPLPKIIEMSVSKVFGTEHH